MRSYPDVVTRLLAPGERALATSQHDTPLVLEARGRRDPRLLGGVLRACSSELLADAAHHGAVLLRGFDIASEADFERTVLAIGGTRGIDRVFMAEEGRTAVAGARYVLHTNAIYTTGGSFDLGTFHTENFFNPDVPRLVFFWCARPSWLGGETGLVDVSAVYADLPARCREALTAHGCLAATFPLEQVARRYQLSAGAVRRFCAEVGLEVVEHDGRAWIRMYKPPVLAHTLTGQPALTIHYWYALFGLGFRPAVQRAFADDYAGPRWALHTLAWRQPRLRRLVPSATLWRAPRIAARDAVAGLRSRVGRPGEPAPPTSDRDLERAFEASDGARIAAAVRARFSSFRWQPGDVLMVDNLRLAHAGMPGLGPRTIRAMICNPLEIPCDRGAPGLWRVPAADRAETFGERIAAFAAAEAAAGRASKRAS